MPKSGFLYFCTHISLLAYLSIYLSICAYISHLLNVYISYLLFLCVFFNLLSSQKSFC